MGEGGPGTWVHIAVTYDRVAGIERIYRNGTIISETVPGTFTPQTTLPLTFGAELFGAGNGGSGQNWYLGALDEVSLYTRPLTPVARLTIPST